MPSVFGGGDDPLACVMDVLEAKVAFIPPSSRRANAPLAPARDKVRDQQVNIGLTTEEKSRLEQLARDQGYRSISDFIRAAALTHPR